jgi:phage shock protein E
MPAPIQRDELRQLLAASARLVEVLPNEEFEREHLPGAVNIPLETLSRETTAGLQRDQPVVVYCADAT